MKSCIVSFAPGTGGFFIGAISQCLLHRTTIKINEDGSCHDNEVLFWGRDRLILENSAEGFVHEIAEIKKHLQVTKHKVVVTHSRNLQMFTERFDKTIYIGFFEEDIPAIQKKFAYKSDDRQEFNYNNIKDSSWPDYDVFKSGGAPSWIYEEMQQRSRMMYDHWTWVLPVLHKKQLFRIDYQSIFGDDPNWLYTLRDFLEVTTDNDTFHHALERWSVYKNQQPC